MNQENMGVGVVGTGYIANKAVGPALAVSKMAKLVAAYDHNAQAASQFCNQYGGRAVADVQSLLHDPAVNIVYVSLPNHLHYEYIVQALSAGKHVICDKPAVLTYEQAQDVEKLCRQQHVRFLEAYAWVFHPQHEAVKAILAAKTIGEVRHLEAWFGFPPLPDTNWRYEAGGGGAFYDLAGYGVKAARYFFEEEPLTSTGYIYQPQGRQVETRGALLLTFAAGKTASFVFGFEHAYRNEYTMWGETGMVKVAPAFTISPEARPQVTVDTQAGVRRLDLPASNQFQEMIDSFGLAIREEKPAEFAEDFLLQAKAMQDLGQRLVRQSF
jgi:dTDP-3,4-didehydro-2,6-dideoxy-alpha-D-glucose 3-reductase